MNSQKNHLECLKIYGGTEPHLQNFLNFAENFALSCLSNVDNIKVSQAILNYEPLKLKSWVFLADHTVAMATYCVMKMITMFSPMVGPFLDTMIVASSDKEWL